MVTKFVNKHLKTLKTQKVNKCIEKTQKDMNKLNMLKTQGKNIYNKNQFKHRRIVKDQWLCQTQHKNI